MTRLAVVALALVAGCGSPPSVAPQELTDRDRIRAEEGGTAPAPILESTKDLKELRGRIVDLMLRSVKLKLKAHEALDQGKYDEAAALHRESLAAAREAEEARGAEEGLIRAAAIRLIADLEHEELAVRDAATRELMELGAAPSQLRAISRNLSAEGKRRIETVLRKLEERLNVRQWATAAAASTEYSRPQWSAAQATGPPDTVGAGDCSTAWASKAPDDDVEWLSLGFAEAVQPVCIRVHETYNAGSIMKVEARDASGAWRTVWEGAAMACETPRWFEVQVTSDGWTTREVRITLDSDAVPGWNEIDAVELVGSPSVAPAPVGAEEGRRPPGAAPR
jgi:hypothetical protein